MTGKILALVALVALPFGWFLLAGSPAASAGGGGDAEAHRLVTAGALLLDVRTQGEFADGHVPGAVNIPVGELAGRLSALGPKDRAIVVYCHSGGRSARAAGRLKEAGYATVHDMGPMSRW